MKKKDSFGTPIDYRGSLIVPGAIVAFNLSGNVSIGEVVRADITKCERATWGYNIAYDIRVKTLYPHPTAPIGHISKVARPFNLVVLTNY